MTMMTMMTMMTTPTTTNKAPIRETRVLTTYRGSYLWRGIFALVLAVLLWLLRENVYLVTETTPVEDVFRAPRPPNQLLCVEDDSFQPKRCSCHDPIDAVPSDDSFWQTHHDGMVAVAAAAATNLDVVLLGDSITERWNGSRRMGTKGPFPECRQVFERYFDRATNAEASLQGVALVLAEIPRTIFCGICSMAC
jgi:hypothetical protein